MLKQLGMPCRLCSSSKIIPGMFRIMFDRTAATPQKLTGYMNTGGQCGFVQEQLTSSSHGMHAEPGRLIGRV